MKTSKLLGLVDIRLNRNIDLVNLSVTCFHARLTFSVIYSILDRVCIERHNLLLNRTQIYLYAVLPVYVCAELLHSWTKCTEVS